MFARMIPLKRERIYTVLFDDGFLQEIARHPRADEILEELDRDLSISERHLPRDTVKKVYSKHGIDIWRHKGGADKDLRTLFSAHDRERLVVVAIPRKTDHRTSDLEAAARRVLAAQGRE